MDVAFSKVRYDLTIVARPTMVLFIFGNNIYLYKDKKILIKRITYISR